MKTIKTFLVDDNEAFRRAFKCMLQGLNFEILGEASSAEEFLKFQYVNSADIIFMDVMMPDMDGISLAKKTLWKNPNLKIIAITMHVDKVYLVSLISAGFVGCISKNNLFNELKPALDAIIGGKLYFPLNIALEK